MSIESIELWHKRARPQPDHNDLAVQFGCHIEELHEMTLAVFGSNEDTELLVLSLQSAAKRLADHLKAGKGGIEVADPEELLDSLADQIVTAVGVGHCAGMHTSKAVQVVNLSNWSKFDENGQPFFNENGKIAKGPSYAPPNLEGLF